MTANPAQTRTAPRDVVETTVPGRLDRLPWTRWHWMVLIGLGTVWILDGLEVTIVGAVGSTLTKAGSGISISTAQIGDAAGIYVAGACLGALVFGHLTDRFGRRRLSLVTLGLYLAATVLTAVSRDAWMFFAFRFFTGMGIGGEYSAINSAIDELIPARVRGTVDLIVNGSYWLGTAVGAAATLVLLDPRGLAIRRGVARGGFFMGALLGVAVLLVRRNLPESPRWLFTHGHVKEADAVVSSIERRVDASSATELQDPGDPITVQQRPAVGFLQVARVVFEGLPAAIRPRPLALRRPGVPLQRIFFTYSLVLTTFSSSSDSVGYYLIAFAAGNFVGPLLLGRLFDVVGRRPMIAGCHLLSGAMLGVTAWLFDRGVLTANTQTVAWVVIFFFASAGASAAYLTVSEIFPMETRALAIAFFYAVGTGLGGIIGPVLFGNLVASKRPVDMTVGYLIGGGLMIGAGLVEIALGVDAEQRSLKDVARPLSALEGDAQEAAATSGAPRSLPRQTGPYPVPRMRTGRTAWTPLPQASRLPALEPLPGPRGRSHCRAAERPGPLSALQISEALGHVPGVQGASGRRCARGGLRPGGPRVGRNRFASGTTALPVSAMSHAGQRPGEAPPRLGRRSPEEPGALACPQRPRARASSCLVVRDRPLRLCSWPRCRAAGRSGRRAPVGAQSPAPRRREVVERRPTAEADSPARARSLFTVGATISSASASERPCSSRPSLMCSYWRSRLSVHERSGMNDDLLVRAGAIRREVTPRHLYVPASLCPLDISM